MTARLLTRLFVMMGLLVAPASIAGAAQQEITFKSNGVDLHGCIVRPSGVGPFPAIIYNHGIEKDQPACGPAELAQAYVGRGYLFFAFERRGQGRSRGDNADDLDKQLRSLIADPAELGRRLVALHDAYNADVVAAVAWLYQRADVDRNRVVMTGVSEGAVQTLLAAEKGLGLRAFVAFAPGAERWDDAALQLRLGQAARDAKAPVFLLQTENDTPGPTRLVGPILQQKGSPNAIKTYPVFGDPHQEGHLDFALHGGIPLWSKDVFAFLDAQIGAPAPPAGEAQAAEEPVAGEGPSAREQPGSPAAPAQEARRGLETLELPGGVVRTYTLRRPAATGPVPTIIMLHGRGGSGSGIGRGSGLIRLAGRDGFAAAFPNGSARRWNVYAPGAAPPRFVRLAEREGGLQDDAAMLKALVADLVRRRIADPKRIYLAGYSDGAAMALTMACQAPQLFAAIGVIAGSMPASAGADCHPDVPLPLVVMNGTADPLVQFSSPASGLLDLWGVDRLLAFFRQLDGCTEPAVRSELPHLDPADMTRVTLESWTSCSAAPILLYRIEGGGHTMPGASTSPPSTQDILGGEALWDFFRDKVRDPRHAEGVASP